MASVDAAPAATAAESANPSSAGRPTPRRPPLAPPTACAGRDGMELRAVVVFEEGFVYPKDMKFSLAVDQELSDRICAPRHGHFTEQTVDGSG